MDRNRRQRQPKRSLTAKILAERRAILERLAARDRGRGVRSWGPLAGDNRPTSEFMEVVQESLTREVELASREALMARLRALARAEEKIRQGSYGRCDVCGQPIPSARLRAVPEAVLCVPCADSGARSLTPSFPSTQRLPGRGRR